MGRGETKVTSEFLLEDVHRPGFDSFYDYEDIGRKAVEKFCQRARDGEFSDGRASILEGLSLLLDRDGVSPLLADRESPEHKKIIEVISGKAIGITKDGSTDTSSLRSPEGLARQWLIALHLESKYTPLIVKESQEDVIHLLREELHGITLCGRDAYQEGFDLQSRRGEFVRPDGIGWTKCEECKNLIGSASEEVLKAATERGTFACLNSEETQSIAAPVRDQISEALFAIASIKKPDLPDRLSHFGILIHDSLYHLAKERTQLVVANRLYALEPVERYNLIFNTFHEATENCIKTLKELEAALTRALDPEGLMSQQEKAEKFPWPTVEEMTKETFARVDEKMTTEYLQLDLAARLVGAFCPETISKLDTKKVSPLTNGYMQNLVNLLAEYSS